MGESSFWYRPTRVVPDQRPLNGRCSSTVFVTTLVHNEWFNNANNFGKKEQVNSDKNQQRDLIQ